MGLFDLFGCCGARKKDAAETAPLLRPANEPAQASSPRPASPEPVVDRTQPSEAELALYAQTLRLAESKLTSLGQPSLQPDGSPLPSSAHLPPAGSEGDAYDDDEHGQGLVRSPAELADGPTASVAATPAASPVPKKKGKKGKKSFKADAGW